MYDPEVYQTLRDAGIKELTAKHVAHLFVRFAQTTVCLQKQYTPEQWFLTFFAPRTAKSQKNFHGPLNYQSEMLVGPEYL